MSLSVEHCKAFGAQKWVKKCLCTGWRELWHFCAGLGPRVRQWTQGEVSQPKIYRNCKWNAQISVGGNVQTQQVDISCASFTGADKEPRFVLTPFISSGRTALEPEPLLSLCHLLQPGAQGCSGLDIAEIFGWLFRWWGYSILNSAKGHILLNANLWHFFSLSESNSSSVRNLWSFDGYKHLDGSILQHL